MTTTKPDLGTLRAQHAARILEDARRIQEFAGYVIDRLERGRPDATGMYLADIVAAGQRAMQSAATIDGLDALADPDTSKDGQ